jgi:hypothetical protein
VPPTHGNAPQRWFATNQPSSGLPAPVYNLVRYSGEARVAAAATLVDKYLQDAGCARSLKMKTKASSAVSRCGCK